jgi:hypothetical protein
VAKEVDSVECRCRFLTQVVVVVGLLSDSQEWEVKVSAAEDSAVTTEVKVAEWVALVVSVAVIPVGTVAETTAGIERTEGDDNRSVSGQFL